MKQNSFFSKPPNLIPPERIPEGCYYDPVAAERPIIFGEKLLKHIKGEWAGRAIILEEWEKDILRCVFGWKKADGTRLIRVLYLEIPRKNGKSLLVTVISLFMLFCDGEPGAEIYAGASEKRQARVVFDQAKAMYKKSIGLRKRGRAFKDRIVYKDSFFEVISADADTKDGYNAHLVIIDELHAQKNRKLYDILRTSMGSRRQPLEVYITTAGEDENSICYELHDYTIKVNQGILKDPAHFGLIYGADRDDDPGDPRVWTKANPNLGVTIKMDYMEKMYQEALAKPTKMPTFKRLHLNIWTKEKDIFIPYDTWKRCARKYTLDDLEGTCYGGVDLSSNIDVTAVSFVFPNEQYTRFREVLHCFIPEATAAIKEAEDRVPYRLWAEQGWVTLTPGEVIDYDFVQAYIDKFMVRFDVREIAFDAWGATQMLNALQKSGAEVIDFRQGFKSMSPAMKDFEALIVSQQLQHQNNPVLNWMMSNMSYIEDPSGNIKPDKGASRRKSRVRIDGGVATIMATARALVYRPDDGSIYEDRGIITL